MKERFFIGRFRFSHDFDVFEKIDLNLKVNGILGSDFLSKYNAQIDYSNFKLTLNKTFKSQMFRFDEVIDRELQPSTLSYIQVPTRHTGQICVLGNEIRPGVKVVSSIQNVKDSAYTLVISNENEYAYHLKKFSPNVQTLCEYDIFSADEQHVTHSVNVYETVTSDDRVRKILSKVKISGMSKRSKANLHDILAEFSDVFSVEGDSLGNVKNQQQEIFIKKGSVPRYVKQYRLPPAQQEIIANKVDEMIKQGIAEPSVSAWNAPVLLVPKKGSSELKDYRLVIDYRKLNDVVEEDKFPIPGIDAILDGLGEAKVFSTLDLDSGYYQVNLAKSSRPFTAFTTKRGHFHLKRMPMGLKTSPACFSRVMQIALGDLVGKACYIYLDDIIVFGKDIAEHNANLRMVLLRLREVGMKVKPSKCDFLKKSVVYLGHVISDEGIKPDPEKFSAILNFPQPKTVKEIQSFVGLVGYYRRFIKNFSAIARPLFNLTKKDTIFKWSTDCQTAFDELKRLVTNPPVLSPPDFSKPFILQTDASDYAVGAVLMNADRRPIAFKSKALKSYQKTYGITDKELLAVVWAVKEFEHYLYGQKFTIETDHSALVHLNNMVSPHARHTRFRLTLAEFDYEIKHIKGPTNVVADALSRVVIPNSSEKDPEKEKEEGINDQFDEILVMTRAMRLANKENEENEKDTPASQNQEQDEKAKKFPKSDTAPVLIQLLRGDSNLWLIKFVDIKTIKIDNQYEKENETIMYDNGTKIILIDKKSIQDEIKTKEEKVKTSFLNLCSRLRIEKIAIMEGQIIEVGIQAPIVLNHLHEHKDKKVQFFLLPDVRFIEDEEERENILRMSHSSPMGGHLGRDKMMRTLKLRYFWPTMLRDIKKVVENCVICQTHKYSTICRQPMVITDIPKDSFEKIVIDLVGPLPKSLAGNEYILTVQDELTKFLEAFPLTDKSSYSVAQTLVEKYFLKYHFPKLILSDCGTEFKNQEMKEVVCKLLKINQNFSAPYHHETIGALENSHRTLRNYMRTFARESKYDWDLWLPYYTYAYNSTVHTSTNYTPFELVFGKNNTLPDQDIIKPKPWYDVEDFASQLKYKLKIAIEDVKEQQMKAKTDRKIKYDLKYRTKENDYKIGDKILIKNETKDKFAPLFHGPYDVINRDENNVYVKIKNTIKKINNNNTKKFIHNK